MCGKDANDWGMDYGRQTLGKTCDLLLTNRMCKGNDVCDDVAKDCNICLARRLLSLAKTSSHVERATRTELRWPLIYSEQGIEVLRQVTCKELISTNPCEFRSRFFLTQPSDESAAPAESWEVCDNSVTYHSSIVVSHCGFNIYIPN